MGRTFAGDGAPPHQRPHLRRAGGVSTVVHCRLGYHAIGGGKKCLQGRVGDRASPLARSTHDQLHLPPETDEIDEETGHRPVASKSVTSSQRPLHSQSCSIVRKLDASIRSSRYAATYQFLELSRSLHVDNMSGIFDRDKLSTWPSPLS